MTSCRDKKLMIVAFNVRQGEWSQIGKHGGSKMIWAGGK